VLGSERDFRLVILNDGQWFAVAETGQEIVSVSSRRWPTEGFELVEVDPLMYLNTAGDNSA
jgi:hypothetical protein